MGLIEVICGIWWCLRSYKIESPILQKILTTLWLKAGCRGLWKDFQAAPGIERWSLGTKMKPPRTRDLLGTEWTTSCVWAWGEDDSNRAPPPLPFSRLSAWFGLISRVGGRGCKSFPTSLCSLICWNEPSSYWRQAIMMERDYRKIYFPTMSVIAIGPSWVFIHEQKEIVFNAYILNGQWKTKK